MSEHDYVIRTMGRDEVDVAVEWAAAEGWNPGLHDADCYFTADREGFLVGVLGTEPVACISAIRYGGTFGFIGFYIVKPAFRGKGYGYRIWQAAMARLAGANVGLDGVVAQQDNYRKSGFTLAYRNIRFEGRGGGATETAGVVELGALPFEQVKEYELPFFPADRSEFLKAWIGQPGSTALGAIDGGVLRGYGVLRPCRTGWKIGPLTADSPALAERLFGALAAKAGAGEPVFLDTPEVNREAVALAERHGMTKSFETARMYTGPAPALPLDRVFGVTSFEIG